MPTEILEALGGLGLFLIGMAIMTEGLKSLAGDSLRRWLGRFTKSPLTGAATGAAATAILQSSSATTVMAVGFAGAGLLTLPQSLGIIFGANFGTTITGWLVALLGFKLKLTHVVMPLVFVGALMRLLGGKRVAAIGYALAGFGLMFTGISLLQLAMEGASDLVTPKSFPPDTLLGRFLLVLIGIVITLVTQSSSAGVATAITAVHVGTLTLPQAAAMVIGMDVGTTVTAAMATVGGTVNARRTGLAHVFYNVMTGAGAFIFLPLYISVWNMLAPDAVKSDPELALVAFHTLFNGLGVLLVLPVTNQFARLIVRLVPAHRNELTWRLDPSLIPDAGVAMDSIEATLRELAMITIRSLARSLQAGTVSAQTKVRLADVEDAVEETRVYLSQLAIERDGTIRSRQVSALHVVDHISRLVRRGRESKPLRSVLIDSRLKKFVSQLTIALECDVDADQSVESCREMHSLNLRLKPLWLDIDQRIEPYRRQTIEQAAHGECTTEDALITLDAVRWLRRVCYHAWRITLHLDPTADSVAFPEESEPATDNAPD